MKLCFISNPNSIHTQRWVNWFSERGHQIYLICDTPLLKPWPSIQLYDLTSHLNLPKLKYLVWIIWTRRILREWQPDILHAHRVTSAGWIGSFTGFHPFVVTPWGTDLYQYPYRSGLAHWLTSHVLKKADLITASSKHLLRQVNLFGALEEKTCLINWGVDLRLFNLTKRTDRLQKKLGRGNGPFVLSLRAIHPLYNQEIILEAIAKVLRVIPAVKLILINYNSVSPYKRMLETVIEELGIRDHVIWFKKPIPWEKMAHVYCMADIGISVPSSDASSVSVLESLACGLPVIVSDLPSLREWIIHGENGFLVPVGDAEELSEAVIQLLRHPEQGTRFQQFNQGLIPERADHQREMAKMEVLYERLLEQKAEKK